MKKAWRIFAWFILGVWLAFVVAICALRFYVLPWLAQEENYFSQIISAQLGTNLTIEDAQPFWNGLEPGMTFKNVKIAHSKRPMETAFQLETARAVFSWKSFLNLFRHDLPSFSWLQAENLQIMVEKKNEKWWLAGFLMARDSDDSNFFDWLLSQNHVRFQNLSVQFLENDAPPEFFHNIHFLMDNERDLHRVQLKAVLPSLFARRVDLRAEFFGRLAGGTWLNLNNKQSTFYAHIENANLPKILSYVDLPNDFKFSQGRANLKTWAHFETHYRGNFSAELSVSDSPITATATLDGAWHKDEGLWGASFKIADLNAKNKDLPALDMRGWEMAYEKERWDIRAPYIALKTLREYASRFAFFDDLKNLQFSGDLKNTHLSWFSKNEFALQTQLQNLSVLKDSAGVENLSGVLNATPISASLHLDSQNAALILPMVFDEPKIPLKVLTGDIFWEKNAEKSTVNLQKISFSNNDFSDAQFDVLYQHNGKGRGKINATGGIAQARGVRVWRYLPKVIHPDVRQWVKNAVQAGTGKNGKLVLKGDLDKFPFKNDSDGIFKITAQAHDAVLEYAPGWPKLEKITAQMDFGLGMKISSNAAEILGTKISNASAEMPDFTVADEILFASGKASGATQRFLQFIDEAEEIKRKTEGLTAKMRAQGSGTLDLALQLPVRHLQDAKVKGRFDFKNNTIRILPTLSEIKNAAGSVFFTESGVQSPKITGRVLDGKINARFQNEQSDLKIELDATTPAENFFAHYNVPLENFAKGNVAWSAIISTSPSREFSFTVKSNFKGFSTSLPAPFNKASSDIWDFSLSGNNHQATVLLKNKLNARVLFAKAPDIAVNLLKPLDLNAWQNVVAVFSESEKQKSQFSTVNNIFFSTPEVLWNQKSFGRLDLKANPQKNGWHLALNNPNVAGDVFVENKKIRAHFSQLNLPESSDSAGKKTFESLPDLELTADAVFYKGNPWGSFTLSAKNEAQVWRINHWQLKNDKGEIAGDGAWWHQAEQAITHLRFDLKTQNAGAFLKRLHAMDAIEGGTAKVQGSMQWNSSPDNIDWASLSGAMRLDVNNASFKKVAPGAGRLLGLLSLQSIVQRLRFNFRDLVTEGLAFHRLSGDLQIKNGVLHTTRSPLFIDAPAAQITFDGKTNLADETLDLSIRIRPSLGIVTALGLAFVNPIAGAASALASTIGANPLDKIIYTHYQVGGTWQEPQILNTATETQQKKEGLWLNTTPY